MSGYIKVETLKSWARVLRYQSAEEIIKIIEYLAEKESDDSSNSD